MDQGRFCQTVNVFDPAYPFHVRDVQTGRVQPSASTRAQLAQIVTGLRSATGWIHETIPWTGTRAELMKTMGKIPVNIAAA